MVAVVVVVNQCVVVVIGSTIKECIKKCGGNFMESGGLGHD